jgi:hypothetical protein
MDEFGSDVDGGALARALVLAVLADGELRDAVEIAREACPAAQQDSPERKVIQDAIDQALPEMHHRGELIYGRREVSGTAPVFGDSPAPPMRVPIYMSAAAFDGE